MARVFALTAPESPVMSPDSVSSTCKNCDRVRPPMSTPAPPAIICVKTSWMRFCSVP